ncbi:MAG TPA: NAD-binding protein [Gemmatimonadota bacterium]|nr:NAD-binding protein [Gemmatimonadota bacterium]
MKFLPSTFLASLLEERGLRRNLGAVARYVALLCVVILVFTVIFHFIMWEIEGVRHSWITGLYWTLTVMSTLGFGDITFQSDVGRLFSVFVLVSGIILLLVLLPFVFIRYFYAPWLEAKIGRRAARRVPDDLRGHVLLTAYDSVAEGLLERLDLVGIPCFVLEPDASRAAEMHDDDIRVVHGAIDDEETYTRLGAERARLVVVNGEDTTNTNVILTIREVAPEVEIVAVTADPASVDVLELAGATHVLTLKQRLGQQIANRVAASHAEARPVGSFRNLIVGEFSVHNTPLSGKTIRESRLREATGVNIVGLWEEATLHPAGPEHRLSDNCMPVVVGSRSQIQELNEFLAIYDPNPNPVLIIGGGKVGRAAARALKDREVPVHMIERKPELRDRIGDLPDRLFIGDAAERELLEEAGIARAHSVVLTTNDDAMNIYLAVYCRRLNPELRIVSRITHARNVTAIRRAGVDLVLSYAALGVESVLALLQGRNLIFLGEGVQLDQVDVPPSLRGKTLGESDIRARTGLNVVALESETGDVVNPGPEAVLTEGTSMLMIGASGGLEEFRRIYHA